jgi:TonB-linked SusC/RagA family outer membrane protein
MNFRWKAILFSCIFLSGVFVPALGDNVPGKYLIKGVVLDASTGETLPGASVYEKNDRGKGTTTDPDGNFSLWVKDYNVVLMVSYLGMETQQIRLKSNIPSYTIRMKESAGKELEEVVVSAGIIQRNKLGFTGSYNTVSGDELQAIGNPNVLQSLKALDPSFIISDNNLAGSNPNQLATIAIRGGTTMSLSAVLDDTSVNPNEPLFILDGFETTLQRINDMDINRIESITILKDAGSTAIYGSRGANGVVVIESIKPKMGEIRTNYSGDYQLAVADLSVYNLMNAAEKLQFELKSESYYGDQENFLFNLNGGGYDNGIEMYNTNRARVAQGYDTYWLKIPIRTALSDYHSLNVSGGNKDFLYQLGGNYRNTSGVMKGSSRRSFGGNSILTYRANAVSFTNQMDILITNGYDGAWGSFSNFAQANPYYAMRNADGTIPPYIDGYYRGGEWIEPQKAPNPYYNASLESKAETQIFTFTNNTSFSWFIRENLRWQGSLNLNTTKSSAVNFKDPRHTDFSTYDYRRQGEYTSSDGNRWEYNLNSSVNYTHSFFGSHNITLIGRWAVREQHSDSHSFIATGFPMGAEGIPSFAYSYKENTHPGYSENVRREINLLGAFSYNYRYRYLLDFNYSNDGSTAFGSNRPFHDFWSLGLGWNINKEAFAKDWTWIQELKLRGSYGINGNQNVNNVTSSVYSYMSGNDIFGMASYLYQFANRDLQWQVAEKRSAGLNASFRKRLTITADVYRTATNPLVVELDQKASTGLYKYPVNMGHITTDGYELTVGYYLVRNMERRILWHVRLMGGSYTSTYGGFNTALAKLNSQYKTEAGEQGIKAENNINSLKRYEDGNSPTALWAVRSLGIDPATGNEVFQSKSGQPTLTYNSDDRVVIADSKPLLEGVFGMSLTYKHFIASFNIRYRWGGYDFNRALYSKVENISTTALAYNQDKRALYGRWQNPGDIAEFKRINLQTSTPVSSRFIQRNNMLRGESARISWDFSTDKWIKKIKLRDLRLNFSMTDVFTWSTMKQERGIDYPFQRGFSVGLTAGF